MPITPIHENMRRRLISNAGEKGAYLHEDHSALLAGTSWKDEQQAAAGTEGLTIAGNFSAPQIGTYVENLTQGFIAQILGTVGGELQMHYPLQTVGTNWGTSDGTSAGKLVDSTATFTQTASVGMIVALRNLDDHAIVTAIDSDTQLSVSKDIFPSGTKYSIMRGFNEGDTVRLGTAVLDGSAGHCMVEMPRFYYGHTYMDPDHLWTVWPGPKDGLDPFPAFKKPNGGLFDHIYIGAFEAAAQGRGQGEERLTNYNLGSDPINSFAGFQPVTYGQRSEFRQAAGNVGSGWQIIDWYINWAWQLLFITEYNSMHSQQALGDGVTNWGYTEWREEYNNGEYFPISHNGFSIPAGNNSLNDDGGASNVGGFLTYRGIENPWGNIWKWLDGVNYNDGRVYLANDPANYDDDIDTDPYFDTGVIQPDHNGYQSKIHNTPHGLLVESVDGASGVNDYYWYTPGWRVARAGGSAARGAAAGFAALDARHSSSHRGATIGSRVCLKL